MLLAVDVGNTQTVLGLFEGERLADSFRLATDRSRTGDELGVTLAALFELEDADGICLSTTVPALQREWERVAERWAQAPLLTVGPGVKTGIPIRYDDPREVGPDRIVNAVAACERYGPPCIVVDFGTARTSTSSRRRASTSAGCSRRGSRSRWTHCSRAPRDSSRSTSLRRRP